MTTNRLAGIVLITVGVLIAGASGLCSAALLSDAGGNVFANGDWQIVALFGGVPFLIGVMCIFGGWLALRNDAKRKARSRGNDQP